MGIWSQLFGNNSSKKGEPVQQNQSRDTSPTKTANNIPPNIPQTVRAILAFMPNLDAAQKVVDKLPDPSSLSAPLKVLGGPTKQGRHQIQITGEIPKNLAIPLLQTIDALGGDIQVVAG
jgi:hypothetical protein